MSIVFVAFEWFIYGFSFLFGCFGAIIITPVILYELSQIYLGIRTLVVSGYKKIIGDTKEG